MKHCVVFVITLCIFGEFAENKKVIPQSVSEAVTLFTECLISEGISPCLKMKALTLIDRVSRMEKITLINGVELKGKRDEKSKEPTPEEEEQILPRAVDAKDQALTTMIFNRIGRAIGSKTIEISMPKIIESARKSSDEFLGRFGDGGGSSGGGGGGGKKEEKRLKGMFITYFLASLLAKKIAMIPLYVGGLFILALKALIASKAALLIIGSIVIKKLLQAKQHSAPAVHHVSAEHGHSGWGGWGRRSYEDAQSLAFQGQKPT